MVVHAAGVSAPDIFCKSICRKRDDRDRLCLRPSKPVNRTGFWCDSQGVVTRIRTNDAAYGQGLRLKDTVMTVDGIRWTDIPEEKREDIYSTEERTVWEIRSADGTKKIII